MPTCRTECLRTNRIQHKLMSSLYLLATILERTLPPFIRPSPAGFRVEGKNWSRGRMMQASLSSVASPARLVGLRAAPREALVELSPPPPPGEEWYEVAVHTVTVKDRQRNVVHTFEVPEDQYILHTAEDQKINLPFSCRHGCCTACAVRVKSGQLYQPEALGISAELKAKGYGLLCVGYPLSDLEVETQDEDEVYWLQFGQYFARGPVERDDYALELAVADE